MPTVRVNVGGTLRPFAGRINLKGALASFTSTAPPAATPGDLATRVLWGVSPERSVANDSLIEEYDRLQSSLGRLEGLGMFWRWGNYPTDGYFPGGERDVLATRGTAGHRPVLHICWEAFGKTFSDILAGTEDAYIDHFITEAAKYPGLVILRIFHEMNGNWDYPWQMASGMGRVTSYAQWIQTWQYVVARARAVPNSENVKFFFCPDNEGTAGQDWEQYWPGNSWVDIIGCDAYGGFGGSVPDSWVNLHKPTYDRLTALHPTAEYWVGETGRWNQNQGDVAAWYDAAYKVQLFPRMAGIMWYSIQNTATPLDQNDFRIDTNAAAIPVHQAQLPRGLVADYDVNGVSGGSGTAPPPDPEPTNLVPNGGFESGVTGWAGENATLAAVTTPVRSGTQAAQLTVTAAGDAHLKTAQFFNVTPGATYTPSLYQRSATVGREGYLQINWWTVDYGYIATVTHGYVTTTTTGWTQQAGPGIVAPANATRCEVKASFVGCAAGEVHYVDDVSLAAPVAPASNPFATAFYINPENPAKREADLYRPQYPDVAAKFD